MICVEKRVTMNGKDFLEDKIAEGTTVLEDAVREIKRLAKIALKAQRDTYAYQLALAALTRDDDEPYKPPSPRIFWLNIEENDRKESELFSFLECDPTYLMKSKKIGQPFISKINDPWLPIGDSTMYKSLIYDCFLHRDLKDDSNWCEGPKSDLWADYFKKALSEGESIRKKGKSLDISNTSSTGVVRRILMSAPGPLTIDEMLQAVPADLGFEMTRETIYGILPRMEARGEITRTRRGEYRYNTDFEDQDEEIKPACNVDGK